MKARYQLPAQILEAARQASQLCDRYQIRRTHDGLMVWKHDTSWKWWRPFDGPPPSNPEDIDPHEQAIDYLFNKLPPIESEL